MKKCKKCGVDKELTDFSKHQAYPDKRARVCKECANIKARAKLAEKSTKPEPWFIFD